MIYRVDLLLPSGHHWRPLVAADSTLEATAKAQVLSRSINGKDGQLVGLSSEPSRRLGRRPETTCWRGHPLTPGRECVVCHRIRNARRPSRARAIHETPVRRRGMA